MKLAKKKILIAAGGTGGHVYPAQGFAAQLEALPNAPSFLFAAGGLNTNRYFSGSPFPFKEVACSPLISRNPLKVLKGIYNLVKGTKQGIQLIKEYKPDAVVAFGSYYTLPILLAAKLQRIPIILHEANSVPGKANKWFAPFSKAVGVHFPMTIPLLKGEVMEVGMPLRPGYSLANMTKIESLAYYGLKSDRKTLLIFGGSQGAKGINGVVKESLQQLRELAWQVIHLTGDQRSAQEMSEAYRAHGITAVVKPFEKEMQWAWGAADLFIGRAGASTIAEAVEFEVPGLLIPYPYATDDHQNKNADFLVETVGSAVKLQEKEMTAMQLVETLKRLTDPEILKMMSTKAREYKQRPNKLDLCQLVMQTIV